MTLESGQPGSALRAEGGGCCSSLTSQWPGGVGGGVAPPLWLLPQPQATSPGVTHTLGLGVDPVGGSFSVPPLLELPSGGLGTFQAAGQCPFLGVDPARGPRGQGPVKYGQISWKHGRGSPGRCLASESLTARPSPRRMPRGHCGCPLPLWGGPLWVSWGCGLLRPWCGGHGLTFSPQLEATAGFKL